MAAQQFLQCLQRGEATLGVLLAIAAAQPDASDHFVVDDDRKAADEHRELAVEAPLDAECLVAGQSGAVRGLIEQMRRTLVAGCGERLVPGDLRAGLPARRPSAPGPAGNRHRRSRRSSRRRRSRRISRIAARDHVAGFGKLRV